MSTRYVLITGCTDGGIGSNFAMSFQRRGYHVFATARSITKMSHLQDKPGITLLPLDVTSPASIHTARGEIEKVTGGKLHVLVNNSGVSYVMPTIDADIEEAKGMFDVNLWGVLAMTKAFYPLLGRAKGCIVNMGSIMGVLNTPWCSLYAASKAALITTSETLRLELAPFGIRVLTVVTGAVQSNIMSHTEDFALPDGSWYGPVSQSVKEAAQGISIKSWMPAEKYADQVVADVTNEANGKIYRGAMASMVNLFLTRLPSFLLDIILQSETGLYRFSQDKTVD